MSVFKQVLFVAALSVVGASCAPATDESAGHDDDHAGHDDQGDHEAHADHDDHEGHEAHAGHDDHAGHEAHDDHEGHEEEEEGTVSLTPEAAERSGIRVSTATAGSLQSALTIPAEVQLNPDGVAHISPLVDGQLLRVDVALGDRVEPEQTLGELRSVELGQARADLSRATSMRDVARQTRDRQRQLREEGINSQRSLVEAELMYEQADAERDAARSRLQVFGLRGGSGPDMELQSPIAGIVLERHATRGENVSPEDTLFVVADLERVWIIGRVYEQQVSQVQAGMDAALNLTAYPERTWAGTVDYVGSALDEATRTLPIRVELDNVDGLLRPGLFGTLRLVSATAAQDAVLVPAVSVLTLNGGTVVFQPSETPGEYHAHPVTVGREDGTHAEIIAGLEAGDEIVVRGAFVLKSELMRSQLGHGHAH